MIIKQGHLGSIAWQKISFLNDWLSAFIKRDFKDVCHSSDISK